MDFGNPVKGENRKQFLYRSSIFGQMVELYGTLALKSSKMWDKFLPINNPSPITPLRVNKFVL